MIQIGLSVQPPKNACALGGRASITHSAAIERAATLDTSPELSGFAARVQREASRRGFTEAQCPVVLGDGSAWIWNSTMELFPQATQILDRFHAKEHLSQVGKIIYVDSPDGKPWIQARYAANKASAPRPAWWRLVVRW